jgi:D-threo-aldose 1-dehydrogenase
MDPFERVRLGTSGVSVPRLGLGTVPLGHLYEPVAEQGALEVVRRSFALGVRLFDTAPMYGHGLAEQRLGEVLPGLPRDEYIVATKVGRRLVPASLGRKVGQVVREAVVNRDFSRLTLAADRFRERLRSGAADAPQARPETYGRPPLPRLEPLFDFSHDGVLRTLEGSLERLGLERVDIVHLHDPDYYHEQALGAFRTLERLRADGTIGAIGVGMNHSAPLARFAAEAPFDCFLVAGRYTLLDQTALADLLPACVERGMSAIVGGIYNSGILADPSPGAHFDYHPASPEILERARRMAAVCARHGVPLMAAAIQFPFGHPAVASVLAGSRSVAEIEQNAAMLRHPIPADLWAELKAEDLLPADVPTPAPASVPVASA